MKVSGKQLIVRGPALNMWRAPTHNDANTWGDQKAAIRWREAGLDVLCERTDGVSVSQPAPQAIQVRVYSTVLPNPDASAPASEELRARLEQLRMGMEQRMDEGSVRDLCAQWDLPYDSLPGSGRSGGSLKK